MAKEKRQTDMARGLMKEEDKALKRGPRVHVERSRSSNAMIFFNSDAKTSGRKAKRSEDWIEIVFSSCCV